MLPELTSPVTVGSRLNLTPINVGFDGACGGEYQRSVNDDFSLRKLVDAITSGDWISADRWPDHIRLSDLEPLFVYQACGRRGADIRPDWDWETVAPPRERLIAPREPAGRGRLCASE
jgi:hypothetical protein